MGVQEGGMVEDKGPVVARGMIVTRNRNYWLLLLLSAYLFADP